MQDFFRQWHEATQDVQAGGIVDISQIPLIREMNQRLKDEMDSKTFFKRFAANLAQLETVACEIVEHSGLAIEVPVRKPNHPLVRPGGFEGVLHPKPATERKFLVPQ